MEYIRALISALFVVVFMLCVISLSLHFAPAESRFETMPASNSYQTLIRNQGAR